MSRIETRSDRTLEAVERTWDAIVIGSGMAGASVAYRLTELGLSVLILEKGLGSTEDGSFVDQAEDPRHRANYGWWPEQLDLSLDGKSSQIWPMLGCGVGGSTLLYAAALGRLESTDFECRQSPDGRKLDWPISYSDLEPYYLEIERLFRTCGTADPLAPYARYALAEPPPLGRRDVHFIHAMQANGLHPYRMHNAMDYLPGCDECGGKSCSRGCRGNAKNRLIEPALATGRLHIEASSEVISLNADREHATSVTFVKNGNKYMVKGTAFVMAAGALATPVILQRSRSTYWPQGIGNDNDLVGRNLMFHASDFIAVWPKKKIPIDGPQRTIAFRDFYDCKSAKLGEVQSMGLSAGYGQILTYLHQKLDGSPLRKLPLVRSLLRIPARLASYAFKEATVFASILEDHPYLTNRVYASKHVSSGRIVEYKIPGELRQRTELMRKLITSQLRSLRVLVINQEISLNYGHACGTCRMGDDPKDSVVDASCRVHGMENVYIVDGSVMATSGGTNPSLTIGALALRAGNTIGLALGADDALAGSFPEKQRILDSRS